MRHDPQREFRGLRRVQMPNARGNAVRRADNVGSGSERPQEVTSQDLERQLRECFTRQVATPSAGTELAATVVRRARRVHRRRSTLGIALAAAATLLATGVATQLGGTGGGPSTSSFAGNPLGGPAAVAGVTPSLAVSPAVGSVLSPGGRPVVDLVVGAVLRSADGRTMDLSKVGTVTWAQQTQGGWLVAAGSVAGAGRTALWSLNRAGSARLLIPEADEIVVSADGARAAWRDGARMFIAPVSATGMGTAQQAVALPDGVLVGVYDAGVLLAHDVPGVDSDRYSLWRPDRGPYRGSWSNPVHALYGALPDGRTLVGSVSVNPGSRPCLALLDVDRISATKTTCAMPLRLGDTGTVSPDGRWLIVNAAPAKTTSEGDASGHASVSAGAVRAVAVDLRTAFGDRAVVREAGPRLAGSVAWIGNDTFVHADEHSELVRVALHPQATGPDPDLARFAVDTGDAGEHPVVIAGRPVHTVVPR